MELRAKDGASLSQLIALERDIAWWNGFLKILTIPSVVATALLVLAILVQFGVSVWRAVEVRMAVGTAQAATGTYSKWLGFVSTTCALGATFTLFGSQAGEPTDKLELRIQELRDGYADYRKESETVLDGRRSRMRSNVHEH